MPDSESATAGGGSAQAVREVPGPPGPQQTAESQAQQPLTENAVQETQTRQETPPQRSGPSRQELLSAIEALPERFITGVREAFPVPPNAQPKAESAASAETSTEETAAPAEPEKDQTWLEKIWFG